MLPWRRCWLPRGPTFVRELSGGAALGHRRDTVGHVGPEHLLPGEDESLSKRLLVHQAAQRLQQLPLRSCEARHANLVHASHVLAPVAGYRLEADDRGP